MVAIVVILAAVIAAFVFGMAGSTNKMHNVAATAQVVGSNTVVTYQGGPDHAALSTNATAQVLDAHFYKPDGTEWTGTGVTNFPVGPVSVGDIATAPHTAGGVDHVVVIASFTDGSQQVILDSRL